jgi:hypothetical protein
MTGPKERPQNMISVRLGCDIRSGPAGQKNDANVKATALA